MFMTICLRLGSKDSSYIAVNIELTDIRYSSIDHLLIYSHIGGS